MAEGANQGASARPVTMASTGPAVPEAPENANVPSYPLSAASRLAIFAAGGISVSLIVAAAITFVVYVQQRQRNSRQPSGTWFCCPDEVREIDAYVNKSVIPCEDFFGYVCSSTTSHSPSEKDGVGDQLRQAVITGVVPAGISMPEAGRFLNAYYQTCVQAVLHHHSLASSLANALLRHTKGILTNAGSRDAMMFILAASLRYSLTSVIRVTYYGATRLYLAESVTCRLNSQALEDLTTTIGALSSNVSTVAVSERTTAMAAALCAKMRGRVLSKTYDIRNGSSAFSREVWNFEDIKAAADAYGIALDVLRVVGVRGTKIIRYLYELFSGEADPLSKAAYLVWHVVASGMREFHIKTGAVSTRVFGVCTDSIRKLNGLWGLFQAELQTSHEKDVQARNVFAAVRQVAQEQLRSSPLIEPEDAEELKKAFDNVSLILPVFANKLSLTTPNATPDFAENVLAGRAYNLDLRKARMSILSAKRTFTHRHAHVVDDRYILLPSNTYNFIRAGLTRSKLPNMALMGQLLAESLWLMALNTISWRPTTAANIAKFKDCFVRTYLEGNVADVDAEYALYSALGLSTVLGTLNSTEWHKVKIAWSLWRLSDAQFFYVFSSRHRCPRIVSAGARARINAPLMYIEDFAKAYSCSRESPMARPRRCLVHGVPPT
ncbi:hypothetical protein HPB50_020043 [Hyalomma asiaticum]|uniref:Uncharacterized protein n=1 Tax=Hyalomma asiaticum TaxID=266040 RepID=A0ACB7SHD4_HYAAI|nr:hypothetical protein HPB50_020043 [Hyalomma asiaticum]